MTAPATIYSLRCLNASSDLRYVGRTAHFHDGLLYAYVIRVGFVAKNGGVANWEIVVLEDNCRDRDAAERLAYWTEKIRPTIPPHPTLTLCD